MVFLQRSAQKTQHMQPWRPVLLVATLNVFHLGLSSQSDFLRYISQEVAFALREQTLMICVRKSTRNPAII